MPLAGYYFARDSKIKARGKAFLSFGSFEIGFRSVHYGLQRFGYGECYNSTAETSQGRSDQGGDVVRLIHGNIHVSVRRHQEQECTFL